LQVENYACNFRFLNAIAFNHSILHFKRFTNDETLVPFFGGLSMFVLRTVSYTNFFKESVTLKASMDTSLGFIIESTNYYDHYFINFTSLL
jgi:hypothetical protein